jgi:putative sterol carrier protein
MSDLSSSLARLTDKFNPGVAVGLDVSFQFIIEDDQPYYLTIKDQQCQLHPGNHQQPSVTLTTDSETLNGIIQGQTNGMEAFMAGKLRAEGDLDLATKLGELFNLG